MLHKIRACVNHIVFHGKYEQWALTNDWMWKDQWQRFHSTTPYFMPFMLWRDGSVRPGTAHALIAAWFLLVATLIGVLLLVLAKAQRKDFQERVHMDSSGGGHGLNGKLAEREPPPQPFVPFPRITIVESLYHK